MMLIFGSVDDTMSDPRGRGSPTTYAELGCTVTIQPRDRVWTLPLSSVGIVTGNDGLAGRHVEHAARPGCSRALTALPL